MKLKHCHQSHWKLHLSRLLLAIEHAQAYHPGEETPPAGHSLPRRDGDEGCTAPASPVSPQFTAGEPAPPMAALPHLPWTTANLHVCLLF